MLLCDMLKSPMSKHNLLSFESFSKVEKRYLFQSSVFYPLGAYMWQSTINFYMDHDEDSNAFVDEQRSSRIWNWITSLMFNPTPTALVRVCLETKFSPSIAVLLVRSHLLFFFFGTWASDILTSSVIYYRKDLLKAQKNLIHLSNSMNRKKIGKLPS